MNLAAKTCSGCLNPAARRLGPKKEAGAQPPRINAEGLHPGLGCTGAFPRVRRTHTLPSRCPGALALPACLPRVPSRGGNSPAGACVFLLPCSIQRGPRVSGDPAPPSQRRANREAVGGAFSPARPAHVPREPRRPRADWLAPRAQVRASYWVWAEREPPRLLGGCR